MGAGLPVAATVKLAAAGAVTVWLEGGVVMAAAVVTVRMAGLLVIWPNPLVTVTV